MTKERALEILKEFAKWRKGESPYDEDSTIPFSVTLYGEALGVAIKTLEGEV